jgi:hypothetical protein
LIVVECDRCFARHRYDEAKFEGRPSKKLKCVKCQAVFEIYNTHAWQTLSPLADTALPEVDAPGAEVESDRADTVFGRRAGTDSRLPEGVKVSLVIISGPQAGRIFPIEKRRVVIGGEGADVRLEDGKVSREHAALEIADEGTWLLDLRSSTGTFVGDQKIREVLIDNRGEFTVGGSTLMLIVTEASSSSPLT